MRLEHLATEDALLAGRSGRRRPTEALDDARSHRATRTSDRSTASAGAGPAGDCVAGPGSARPVPNSPGSTPSRLQALHRSGKYRIVLLRELGAGVCTAPIGSSTSGPAADDAALLDVLGRGTPAVQHVARIPALSARRRCLAPASHSLGNANLVKAQALVNFLSGRVLPPLLAGRSPMTAVTALRFSRCDRLLLPRWRWCRSPAGWRSASTSSRGRATIAGIAPSCRCSAASRSACDASPACCMTRHRGRARRLAVRRRWRCSSLGLVDDIKLLKPATKLVAQIAAGRGAGRISTSG